MLEVLAHADEEAASRGARGSVVVTLAEAAAGFAHLGVEILDPR